MKYQRKKDIKIKKISLLLTMISLIICISTIKTTYAKYITTTSGNANIQIARWKILINNQDINQNNELTSVIQPVFEGNENIAKNVIAPTSEGYFDIIIDATNTDVSFNYEITTTESKETSVSDLVLSSYSINDGQKQDIISDDGQLKLTGNINYTDEEKNIKLRIYLKWNDDDNLGATMDNNADTKATKNETNKASTTINVKFIQAPNNNNNQEEN